MKGNIKGFTLVELLAVIVILGIVALVTTPAILNVINNARRSGAEDKAWGTMDAVRLAYTQSQSIDYDVELTTNQTVLFGTDNKDDRKVGTRDVTVSGEVPSGGYVYINTSDGKITAVNLEFTKNGKYICSSNDTGTEVCCTSGDNPPTNQDSEKAWKKQCGKKFKGPLATQPTETE